MRALYISRYVALVGSLIGAVVVVGTGADLLSTTLEFFDLYFTFNVLAIAVAGLTILTLVPMLIVDGVRDRPFTSLVYVELIWLTILWILWLSSGAYSIWVDSFVYGTRSCNFPGYPAYSKACSEWNAISAFSLINWIFLMSYTAALFVMALIARSNGYRGFTATVREGFGSGAPREPAIPPSASNLNVGDAEKVMTSTQSIPHSRDAPVIAPSSAHTEMPQTGIQRPYNYLPEV